MAATDSILQIRLERHQDGSIVFRWRDLPNADSYRVQIFDTQLRKVTHFEARGDTLLRLPANETSEIPRPALWRVQAYLEGDEIVHSAPAALDLRSP
jgi:hypothetical protein